MRPLIFQSDFGLADGAVCAMYGVACSVDPNIRIYDLTHEIPQYDIWEASYRLIQTINYWPSGSVFVSIVDPTVGSERKSIVAKTSNDNYIVTPDNGTLTHVKKLLGIKEVRIIDETINRMPGSSESYTFHGRDVYAYTGARLASGIITFEQVGPLYDVNKLVELPVIQPTFEDNAVCGDIDVLDVRYGSLWTNIDKDTFAKLNVSYGDKVEVTISTNTRTLYRNVMVYEKSFACVNVGEPLLYINSLNCVAIAINQGNFAKAYNIGTGINWHISFKKYQ